jgi:hypothetical protein
MQYYDHTDGIILVHEHSLNTDDTYTKMDNSIICFSCGNDTYKNNSTDYFLKYRDKVDIAESLPLNSTNNEVNLFLDIISLYQTIIIDINFDNETFHHSALTHILWLLLNPQCIKDKKIILHTLDSNFNFTPLLQLVQNYTNTTILSANQLIF